MKQQAPHFNAKDSYRPGGRGEVVYRTILYRLRNRLLQPGEIKTNDAWQAAGGLYSYSIVAIIFKNVMEILIEEGKAYRVKGSRAGLYHIGKREGFDIGEVKEAVVPTEKELPASVWKGTPPERRQVSPWFSKVYGCYLSAE